MLQRTVSTSEFVVHDRIVVGERRLLARDLKRKARLLLLDQRIDRTATKTPLRNHMGTVPKASDGISHALEAGAKGAIMKNCDFNELLTAIRSVAAGKEYVSPEIRRILITDPPVASLSPRQEEILGSIVRGLSNPDIAKQLGISLDMVKEHVETLFQKIGAANRTEAVAIALRKHLLKS